MDKLGKIRGHHWKERLKIRKFAKFESDLLKTNECISPQSREILQTLDGGRYKLAPPPPSPIQTSLDFRNFTELHLRSLNAYHFQIWQFY